MLSMTELRGNSQVCVDQCETHACLKENTCPMGLLTHQQKRTGHDCGLCFACVRKQTEIASPRYSAPPSKNHGEKFREFSRSTFAVLLVGFVLATGALRWLGDHKTFRVALVIPQIHFHGHWENFCPLAATVGFAGLTFMASGTKGFANWSQNFVYAGYAYLPLAFDYLTSSASSFLR